MACRINRSRWFTVIFVDADNRYCAVRLITLGGRMNKLLISLGILAILTYLVISIIHIYTFEFETPHKVCRVYAPREGNFQSIAMLLCELEGEGSENVMVEE